MEKSFSPPVPNLRPIPAKLAWKGRYCAPYTGYRLRGDGPGDYENMHRARNGTGWITELERCAGHRANSESCNDYGDGLGGDSKGGGQGIGYDLVGIREFPAYSPFNIIEKVEDALINVSLIFRLDRTKVKTMFTNGNTVVTVTIDEQGNSKVEVNGIAGTSCTDLTTALEGLGSVESRELKDEYYEHEREAHTVRH